MAKELPYFKFEPNQWENGNIQICSREQKGLFMDLCSMYWSRLGDLKLKLAAQKLCDGNATALNSLYEDEIIAIEEGFIRIDFLEEQLIEFKNTSTQNSKNAKEGWDKRKKAKSLSDGNATASNPHSENDAIREEKRREEKRREEKIEQAKLKTLSLENDFNKFWDLYDHKKDSAKSKAKFFTLSQKDIDAILKVVSSYVYSTPEKQYRKHPLTWLNGKCWNDVEINEYAPTKERPFGKTNQPLMK